MAPKGKKATSTKGKAEKVSTATTGRGRKKKSEEHKEEKEKEVQHGKPHKIKPHEITDPVAICAMAEPIKYTHLWYNRESVKEIPGEKEEVGVEGEKEKEKEKEGVEPSKKKARYSKWIVKEHNIGHHFGDIGHEAPDQGTWKHYHFEKPSEVTHFIAEKEKHLVQEGFVLQQTVSYEGKIAGAESISSSGMGVGGVQEKEKEKEKEKEFEKGMEERKTGMVETEHKTGMVL